MAQTTTNPDWMTFDERMTEAARILAAGILRGRKRQMNQIKKACPEHSRRDRSFSGLGLDLSLERSVHWNNKPLPKGESR